MTDLIACLSTGKGTIGHVLKVIDGMEWSKVYLIIPNSVNQECNTNKEVEKIRNKILKTVKQKFGALP